MDINLVKDISLNTILEIVKDSNYIVIIDPIKDNASYGETVEISTRDITIDFDTKEIVIYNECDNEEWYRFPFNEYKKTWWLANDIRNSW